MTDIAFCKGSAAVCDGGHSQFKIMLDILSGSLFSKEPPKNWKAIHKVWSNKVLYGPVDMTKIFDSDKVDIRDSNLIIRHLSGENNRWEYYG